MRFMENLLPLSCIGTTYRKETLLCKILEESKDSKRLEMIAQLIILAINNTNIRNFDQIEMSTH